MVESPTSARIAQLATRLKVSIVETADDFSRLAALRYECYSKEGIIAPHPERKLLDRFDGDYSHPTFAISDDTGVVASIRVSLVGNIRDSSPSTLSFYDTIASLVSEGVVVDPNRFVIDRQSAARYPDLHFFVLTIPFALASVVHAAYALAAVRPEHRSFYARTLRYREIAPPPKATLG